MNAVADTIVNLHTVLNSVIFVPVLYQFMYLIPSFLARWDQFDRNSSDKKVGKNLRADFIIVGAGSSGSVLANRLSKHFSVLLLEAGGNPNPLMLVPAFQSSFINQKETDFQYKSVPQKFACQSSVNQEAILSAGKVAGGSSAISYMTHIVGEPKDYDNWAELTGDISWKYENLKPHFDSVVKDQTKKSRKDDSVNVEFSNFHALGRAWVEAAESMGYNQCNSSHCDTEFAQLPYEMKDGKRFSSYEAYVIPVKDQKNLHIRFYALVNRLLFQKNHNLATGVEFTHRGRIFKAYANKEVILSAGTFGSAKILMQSGIGDAEMLRTVGITPRKNSDLPVGKNLQDHLTVFLGPFYITKPSSLVFSRDTTPISYTKWIASGKGPLSTTGPQAIGRITSFKEQKNWPDLNLILYGNSIDKDLIQEFSRVYRIKENELWKYYGSFVWNKDSFHIMVQTARPKSRGQVKIVNSTSNRHELQIDPNYLSDVEDEDFNVLYRGIQVALDIVENSTVFRDMGANFTTSMLPGCDQHIFRSKDYFTCYIRRYSFSSFDFVGTTALGTVVNSQFEVKDSKNLRVIDAGVQPTIITSGTQATTLMMAEKGATAILRKWKFPAATSQARSIFSYMYDENGAFINPWRSFVKSTSSFDPMGMLKSLFAPIKGFRRQGPKYTSPSGDKYYSHDPTAAMFLQNLIDKVSYSGKASNYSVQ